MGVKNQFEHHLSGAGVITGVGEWMGDDGVVRPFFPVQSFFVEADCGGRLIEDFDDTGAAESILFDVQSGHVVGGTSSLVIGGAGEGQGHGSAIVETEQADGIADGKDVGCACFHFLVDEDESFFVELNRALAQKFRIRSDADGEDDDMGIDAGMVAEADADDVVERFKGGDGVFKFHVDVVGEEGVFGKCGDVFVKWGQNLWSGFEKRDAGARGFEIFGHFHADKSPTDDGHLQGIAV